MGRSCPASSSISGRDVRVTSPEPPSVLPRWKSQFMKADMRIPFPLDQSHPEEVDPRSRLRRADIRAAGAGCEGVGLPIAG
jgi:hypothetical protein